MATMQPTQPARWTIHVHSGRATDRWVETFAGPETAVRRVYDAAADALPHGTIEIRRPDGVMVKRYRRPLTAAGSGRTFTATPLAAISKAPHIITDSDGDRVGFMDWCAHTSRYVFCTDDHIALSCASLRALGTLCDRLTDESS